MTTAPRLRPMSIGDMFDAAFRLYRQHFLTFVGVVALLQLPMAIVQFLLQYVVGRQATLEVLRFSQRSTIFSPGSPPSLSTFPFNAFLVFYGITIGLAVFQALIVQSLLTGALANAIARSYLGEPVSILGAYQLGLRRYAALVASSLLLFLLGATTIGLFAGCSVAGIVALGSTLSGPRASVAAGVLGLLAVLAMIVLLIPVVLFFFIRFILTTQAIVLEGRGPLAGLGRSWRLIGTSFWRALLVFVLVLVLSYIISLIPSLLVTFGLGLFGGGATAQLRNQAIASFVSQLGLILGLPLLFSIYTLLYYDLRVRKEGYDLELMAQSQQAEN